MKEFVPMTEGMITAIDQTVEDNEHLIYQDWYFSDEEFNSEHPFDVLQKNLEKARYKKLKRGILSHENAAMDEAHLAEEPFETLRDYGLDIREYAYKAYEHVLPTTYVGATTGPDSAKWIPSTESEVTSLYDQDVFEVMETANLPPGAKVLKHKWVFDIKSDGRFKSRYTIKGCGQRYGIDYDEVFFSCCSLHYFENYVCYDCFTRLSLTPDGC